MEYLEIFIDTLPTVMARILRKKLTAAEVRKAISVIERAEDALAQAKAGLQRKAAAIAKAAK